MQAKTRFTNTVAQWLTVALIALAPLACIEYCRVTHEVAHRAMGHAAMRHEAGDAPLNSMQQLVHAVTDALSMLMAWFVLMIVVAMRILLRIDPLHRAQMPPTPPPKVVVFPLGVC